MTSCKCLLNAAASVSVKVKCWICHLRQLHNLDITHVKYTHCAIKCIVCTEVYAEKKASKMRHSESICLYPAAHTNWARCWPFIVFIICLWKQSSSQWGPFFTFTFVHWCFSKRNNLCHPSLEKVAVCLTQCMTKLAN